MTRQEFDNIQEEHETVMFLNTLTQPYEQRILDEYNLDWYDILNGRTNYPTSIKMLMRDINTRAGFKVFTIV